MNGNNRMKETSKKWLIDALFDMMKKKNYENITVKEISENACLSRRTFYRFFKNKNELLNYFFEKMIDEYLQILNKNIDQITNPAKITLENVIYIFLNFWWSKRQETRILIKQGLFMNIFVKNSVRWKKIYKTFKLPWHIKDETDNLNYISNFFIGGYINVISYWLMSKDPKSTDEISNIIYNSIKNVSLTQTH